MNRLGRPDVVAARFFGLWFQLGANNLDSHFDGEGCTANVGDIHVEPFLDSHPTEKQSKEILDLGDDLVSWCPVRVLACEVRDPEEELTYLSFPSTVHQFGKFLDIFVQGFQAGFKGLNHGLLLVD